MPRDKGIWWADCRDGGRTWSAPDLVTEIEGYEPAPVRAGDRLIVFIRNNTDRDGAQFVAVSDDHGGSWRTTRSPIKPENNTTHRHASPYATMNPARPGELIILSTDRSTSKEPGRIWLWRADAQRLDWKRERVLMEFPKIEGDPNTDLGYPCCSTLADGAGRCFIITARAVARLPSGRRRSNLSGRTKFTEGRRERRATTLRVQTRFSAWLCTN